METINSNKENLKIAMGEIKAHIEANPETVSGKKKADVLMNIHRDLYDLRSCCLNYNKKIEFAMWCDSNSMTRLFQVH